jgi:ribosomal-protein-alanine N-acetyltransferase
MAASSYQDNLESKRLLTRFLTTEDISTWANFFNDKEAAEFLPTFGLSSNLERATYWIQRQLTRYKENNLGLQALIDKKTNEFVGQCGLIKQEVDGQIEIEVGYHIFKRLWGQGYAPEAAKLFIEYAFNTNLTDSVISIIDIQNIKSQIVADKNGLKREKQIKWSGVDVFIYRISKQNR